MKKNKKIKYKKEVFRYSDEIYIKFKIDLKCPECNEDTSLFKDISWILIYTCNSCKSKFEYMSGSSDSGSSLERVIN